MDWMILPLRRYFDFSGRSRPREYWMFVLFCILLGIVAGVIDIALGFGSTSTYADDGSIGASAHASGPVGALTALALVIPSLAVAVRRLHDTDRSGWWLLLLLVPIVGWIVLIVFYCLIGTPGPNRFGPDRVSAAPGSPGI